MSRWLYCVRERFHPLNYLWRHAFSRKVLRAMNIPVWAKLPGELAPSWCASGLSSSSIWRVRLAYRAEFQS